MTVDPYYVPDEAIELVATGGPVDRTPDEAAFSELIASLRTAQVAISATRPDAETSRRAAGLLDEITGMLGDLVPEAEQLSGKLLGEPGQGRALQPPLEIDEVSGDSARGRVTFSRFYFGDATVHGGSIPLVYDEIMGGLAVSGGRPFARTASLKVDYRAGTPLDAELDISAWVERTEGRKVFLRGEMRHEGRLLTECEGLWVVIRQRPEI